MIHGSVACLQSHTLSQIGKKRPVMLSTALNFVNVYKIIIKNKVLYGLIILKVCPQGADNTDNSEIVGCHRMIGKSHDSGLFGFDFPPPAQNFAQINQPRFCGAFFRLPIPRSPIADRACGSTWPGPASASAGRRGPTRSERAPMRSARASTVWPSSSRSTAPACWPLPSR